MSAVLVKLTLDMDATEPTLQTRGFTHSLKLSQEQNPLVLTDRYHGSFLQSSVSWESDTAPAKPRCDVLFLGAAHAPEGRPHYRFPIALKVSAPDQERDPPPRPFTTGLTPDLVMDMERRWREKAAQTETNPIPGEILIHKHLQVSGERWLERHLLPVRVFWWTTRLLSFGLIRGCPLRLTRPKALTQLPLRYEYAFGGHAQVHASAPGSRRVPRRVCLPGVDRAALGQAWQQAGSDALVAEAFWPENPVGRGYGPLWQLKATRTRRLPAPQIEDPAHPFTARAAWLAMNGKAHGQHRLPLLPQGLGVIARTWEPRVGLAGTWDETWAASGAPYPPDFAEAFNNHAHPDLQCRHLAGDETVELTNLCSPSMVGAHRDPDGNQVLRFRLPGLFPFLLLTWENGDRLQVPAILDTLILEPGEGRVTFIQRASYPAEPEPVEVELRLAMPGEPREAIIEPDPVS